MESKATRKDSDTYGSYVMCILWHGKIFNGGYLYLLGSKWPAENIREYSPIKIEAILSDCSEEEIW